MFNRFNILPEFFEDWAKDLTWEECMTLAKEYYGYEMNVGVETAADYYFYGLDEEKVRKFQNKRLGYEVSQKTYAIWGLKELLREHIIAPVCVNWAEFYKPVLTDLFGFLEEIWDDQIAYEVMQSIYRQRERWLPMNYDKLAFDNRSRKEVFALWEAYLNHYEEAAKWQKQFEERKDSITAACKKIEYKMDHPEEAKQVTETNPKQEKKTALPQCPLITPMAVKEGKVEAVMEELRQASKGPARHMVHCLRSNEALGYVYTQCYNTEELHKILVDYFQVAYSSTNLRKYRN
ncbi:MAG: hypothetical protein MJZ84_04625 [Paludibacteraceae bacterium]|nr:hypothetical protein [Paludibacteraceae bacterium]